MSRLPLLALLLTALCVTVPAAASAATFDVTTADDLAAALDTADGNGTNDVITIAPGAGKLTRAGGYVYSAAPSDVDRNLTVEGGGRTIGGSPSSAALIFDNNAGDGSLILTDLTVDMDAGNFLGVELKMPATVQRLNVTGTGNSGGLALRTYRSIDATNVTVAAQTGEGIVVEGGNATYTNLKVSGPDFRFATVLGGTLTMTGATLDQPGGSAVGGVYAESPGTAVTLSRVRILGSYRAVEAASGATIAVSDSLFTAGPGSFIGLLAAADNTLDPRTTTITGERLTIIGANTAGQEVARASGGFDDTEADTTAIVLRDSIVDGLPDGAWCKDYNAQSTVTIAVERSNLRPAGVDSDGCDKASVPGITRTAVTSLDPQFVDAGAGDYRLAAPSPLIDASLAAGGLPGLPALDLGGKPRLNDGDGDCTAELDLGAFETQAPVAAACVPGTPPAGPGPGAGGGLPAGAGTTEVDSVAPAITKLTIARTIRRASKPPVTIRFRLSEAATVKLTFAKAQGKRFTPVKGAITRALKAGDQRLRFAGALSKLRRLAPGSYRVTIVATDAAGNRSVAQRGTFRLRG